MFQIDIKNAFTFSILFSGNISLIHL